MSVVSVAVPVGPFDVSVASVEVLAAPVDVSLAPVEVLAVPVDVSVAPVVSAEPEELSAALPVGPGSFGAPDVVPVVSDAPVDGPAVPLSPVVEPLVPLAVPASVEEVPDSEEPALAVSSFGISPFCAGVPGSISTVSDCDGRSMLVTEF